MNKKAQSIVNLYAEMQIAFNEKSDTYYWITSKCGAQAELASISRKNKGIVKMTLNTFKKYSDQYLDGGFAAIDALRKKIQGERISSLENGGCNEKRSVNKLEEAQREIEVLRRNQAVLVKAYNELNSLTLDLISNSKGNTLEYKRHQELFSNYFELKLVVDND